MPTGLLRMNNKEISYVSARGKDCLLLSLSNQSSQLQKVRIELNSSLVGELEGKTVAVQQWKNNQPADALQVVNGVVEVEVPASGLTALALDGVAIKTRFQQQFVDAAQPWTVPSVNLSVGGGRAMIIAMGRELTSAYIYLQSDATQCKRAVLRYTLGGKEQELEDASFPFEFTVPIPQDAADLSFSVSCEKPDGSIERSETAVLKR
jgi:hypothetical protein